VSVDPLEYLVPANLRASYRSVIQHGLLRFGKQTRTCSQAAVDVSSLAVDETFKGSTFQR